MFYGFNCRKEVEDFLMRCFPLEHRGLDMQEKVSVLLDKAEIKKFRRCSSSKSSPCVGGFGGKFFYADKTTDEGEEAVSFRLVMSNGDVLMWSSDREK